jgi:hypothetical protein
MKPLAEEQGYLRAAAIELPDFLLSKTPTWQLAGPASWPPLTPGYVLLYQLRVSHWPWSEPDRIEVQTCLEKITATCQQWKAAWLQRASQEYPQRFQLWHNYLNDLSDSDRQPHSEYRWQVRWRVMLDLLQDLLEDHSELALAARLAELDLQLRQIGKPGPFLWETELAAAFDPTRYWYLYRMVTHEKG